MESYEGKTPALGDHQARALLDAPDSVSLKGKRDRALPATLLYHALRREELCKLSVKDFRHERRGVAHLKIFGKGSKTRYVPLHPAANGLIFDYLEAAGHGAEDAGALFRPLRNHGKGVDSGSVSKAITPDAVYKIMRAYSGALGSRSAPTRCAQPRRPMRWTTRPTSPRCRSGWGTPTSPPPASTTTARPGPRTVRRSRWRTDWRVKDWSCLGLSNTCPCDATVRRMAQT